MAAIKKATKSSIRLGDLALKSFQKTLNGQTRHFAPPVGAEYGLEKKWAYYNQASIDNFAARVYTLNI